MFRLTFYKRLNKSFYGHQCKSCVSIRMKLYRSTDEYKKMHREKQKKWRYENREKYLEISRNNYKKNGKRFNAAKRDKYKNDPEYKAKKQLRDKQYNDSGRNKELYATTDRREKSIKRSKIRREDPDFRKHDNDRNRKWSKLHRVELVVKAKEKRKSLPDYYIKSQIRKLDKSIKVEDISTELVELKRQQLKLFRAVR